MRRLFCILLLSCYTMAAWTQLSPTTVLNDRQLSAPKDSLFQQLLLQQDLFLNEFTFRPKRGLGLRELPDGAAFVFFEHLQEGSYQLILMRVDSNLATTHIRRIDLAQGHRVADIFWVQGAGPYLVGERYGEKGQQVWAARYNENFELQEERYLFKPQPNRFLEQALVTGEGALLLLAGDRLDSLQLWSQLSWTAPLTPAQLQSNQRPLALFKNSESGAYLYGEEESKQPFEPKGHFLASISKTGVQNWKLLLTASFTVPTSQNQAQIIETGDAKLLAVTNNAQGETFALVENVKGIASILKITAHGKFLGEQKSYSSRGQKEEMQLLLLNSEQLLSLTGFSSGQLTGAIHPQQKVAPYYHPNLSEMVKPEGLKYEYRFKHLLTNYGFFNCRLQDAIASNNGRVLLLYDNMETKDLRLSEYGPLPNEVVLEKQ